MNYTILELPDSETVIVIPAGTVVYRANRYVALEVDTMAWIDARGNTNYDNQRRAKTATGIHMFWIKGQWE